MMKTGTNPEIRRRFERRDFLKKAGAGTLLVALGGGLYRIASDDLTREARAEKRSDGRPRLPPGQKLLEELKPMGGERGSQDTSAFSLRVHGEVESSFTLDWNELVSLPQTRQEADVHCVTGWSVLGSVWTGVNVKHLAEKAGLKDSARHVIFEAAHGYTANVPLDEALADNVMVAHRLDKTPLPARHGAPVRALVPDLYFWKSAKWLTGIKFVRRDEPGYWETRGYHNRGDPWREERHG